MTTIRSQILGMPARIARTGEWKGGDLMGILRANGMPDATSGTLAGPVKEAVIAEKTLVENAARIASLDLSEYVDWSIYKGFDFEAARKKCVGYAMRYAKGKG
jgi:hypothetical protein